VLGGEAPVLGLGMTLIACFAHSQNALKYTILLCGWKTTSLSRSGQLHDDTVVTVITLHCLTSFIIACRKLPQSQAMCFLEMQKLILTTI